MEGQATSGTTWRVLLASSVISILFGFFLHSRVAQIPQENDSESFQTIQEAQAIVQGCHRYGLLEYTHHPIGRAYLLTPFIGKLENLDRVPIVIAVVTTTLALFACLMVPAPLLVKVPILATFMTLTWQGGFMTWMGNLHQHSYNFSIFFLLVAVGVTFRRVWPALAVLAFIAGWIGYDFLFIFPFAIVTIRFLYWTGRESNGWTRAAWAACGETCVFLAVFIFDMTLKFVQNTLYFSSAVMAQQDLFLNILYRTSTENTDSMSPSWRLDKASRLLSVYLDRFINDSRVANKESLLVLCALSLLIMVAQLWCSRRSPNQKSSPNRWGRIALAILSSSMTIVGWLLLAPNHAEPHVSLFVRLLLIPCVLFPLSISLGFAYPRSLPMRASPPRSSVGILLCLGSAGLFVLLPLIASQKIDDALYASVWDSQSAGIRQSSNIAPVLAASPTASSVSPDSDLTGPLKPKGEMKLVYVTNFWGRNLDEAPSLRWMPDPKLPLPAWYQIHLPRPTQVSHVALRFWDLPKRCGTHTPAIFALELLDQNGQTIERIPLSSTSGWPTHQGKYLNLFIPLSSNAKISDLRLVVEKTVGGGVPVIFDFQAFEKKDS